MQSPVLIKYLLSCVPVIKKFTQLTFASTYLTFNDNQNFNILWNEISEITPINHSFTYHSFILAWYCYCWCNLKFNVQRKRLVVLHWRHNDHGGVSNLQPHGCLLNRLFRRRSKKASKLRVTGLCAGNSPGPGNSPHKGPVTRKMVPFDDVIMESDICDCVYIVWTVYIIDTIYWIESGQKTILLMTKKKHILNTSQKDMICHSQYTFTPVFTDQACNL